MRVFIYTALFFLLLLTLSYVRFPGEVIGAAVSNALMKTDSRIQVEISGSELTIPPGVRFAGIEISKPGAEIIDLSQVTLTPDFSTFLGGDAGFTTNAKTLGGAARVNTVFNGWRKDDLLIDFSFDKLDIALLPVWKKFPWARLSGNLAGEGGFAYIEDPVTKGDGRLTTTLGEGSLTLSPLLMAGKDPIVISGGESSIIYNHGRVVVDRLNLTGPELDVTVTGSLILSPANLRFSHLNLTVKIRLDGELENRVGGLLAFFPKGDDGETLIRIGGTIANPKTL